MFEKQPDPQSPQQPFPVPGGQPAADPNAVAERVAEALSQALGIEARVIPIGITMNEAMRSEHDPFVVPPQIAEANDLRRRVFDALYPDDEESGVVAYARKELSLAGLDQPDADYGGATATSVLELVRVFAAQHHSGGSATLTRDLFVRIVNHEPLTPNDHADRTDVSDLMNQPEGTCFQDNRDPRWISTDQGATWRSVEEGRSVATDDEAGLRFETTLGFGPVVRDVAAERMRQEAKWGAAHDDQHNAHEWLALIYDYLSAGRRAAHAVDREHDNRPKHLADFRRRLVQVAALSVATLEAFDRQGLGE